MDISDRFWGEPSSFSFISCILRIPLVPRNYTPTYTIMSTFDDNEKHFWNQRLEFSINLCVFWFEMNAFNGTYSSNQNTCHLTATAYKYTSLPRGTNSFILTCKYLFHIYSHFSLAHFEQYVLYISNVTNLKSKFVSFLDEYLLFDVRTSKRCVHVHKWGIYIMCALRFDNGSNDIR